MTRILSPPPSHRLPASRTGEDGYEWMEEAQEAKWQILSAWGRNGWDLGSWPCVVVAIKDDGRAGVWSLAVHTEGDVETQHYSTEEERDAAIDRTAEWYWRRNANGPLDIAEHPEGHLPSQYRGRYSSERADAERRAAQVVRA
ncbi:MAG: hypothetical protein HYT80_00505 [Euryarchaeota archaeon]|nr:hypothetical protein [Euryarchaeota archaeon]